MNTIAFQENKPEPVHFSNYKGWEYFEDGKQTTNQIKPC